jgi:hypothetical protein
MEFCSVSTDQSNINTEASAQGSLPSEVEKDFVMAARAHVASARLAKLTSTVRYAHRTLDGIRRED